MDHNSAKGWPVCPSCGAFRMSRCPWCGTWGTEFRWGAPAPDGSGPRRRICPTCDEPLVVEFAPRCEWCGQAFDDGFALPAAFSGIAGLRRVVLWLALAGAVAAAWIWLARGAW